MDIKNTNAAQQLRLTIEILLKIRLKIYMKLFLLSQKEQSK